MKPQFASRVLIGEHYLTAQECVVIWYCSFGMTNVAIAELLFNSPKTIERHKENIRKRFGLKGHHAIHQFAYSIHNQLSDIAKFNENLKSSQ